MTEQQPEFRDKIIICKECGLQFPFTIGEQQYFRDRNLVEPKRCPKCRARRRRPICNATEFLSNEGGK